MKLGVKDQKIVADYAKALSNPIRVQILYFLASRLSCYFGSIYEDLPIAKATVSQHLKELKRVGLIDGTIEGPKTKYCINRDKWIEARTLFAQLFCDCNIASCKMEDKKGSNIKDNIQKRIEENTENNTVFKKNKCRTNK